MKNFSIVDKIKSFKFYHYRDNRIFKLVELKDVNLIEKKNITDFGEKPKLKVEETVKDKNEINKKILDLLEKIRNYQLNSSINNSIGKTNLYLYTSYSTKIPGTDKEKFNTLEVEIEYDEKYREYFEKVLENVHS